MIRVIVRRLLIAVPILFAITTITFFLIALIPGDPANALLGPDATAEEYAALRAQLGLDRPIFERYLTWMGNLLTGDFGVALRTGAPVIDLIATRFPVTLSMAVLSLIVTAVVGIALGLVAALVGGRRGRAAQVVSVLGASLPNFWVGILLVLVFSVTLRWLPAVGYVPIEQSVSDWVRSLILPVVAISLAGVAAVARQTRGSVIDVVGQDYIRTHLSLGMSRPRIIFKHILRNAAIPITTTLSFQFIVVLSGAIVVESVFALPGMGQLMVTAITNRDAAVAQGVVVVTGALVIIVTLLVDLINAALNPKARHR